jgi:hypothetical protein
MDKIITVQGKNIQMEMTQHKVKLVNNDQLSALLVHNTEASTDELVAAIKTAFQQQNNRELDISNASMAVEIWGHVYTESFAAAIKSLSPFGFVDSLADKIIGHCEVIDMGESGRDNNRFIWDRLASLKSSIARFLPKTTA